MDFQIVRSDSNEVVIVILNPKWNARLEELEEECDPIYISAAMANAMRYLLKLTRDCFPKLFSKEMYGMGRYMPDDHGHYRVWFEPCA